MAEEIVGKRELIVQVKGGIRATPAGLSSTSGADVAPLQDLLAAEGVAIEPLFGESEERLDRKTASLAVTADGPVPQLSSFYLVQAVDARLDQLAERLRGQVTVGAAYVKPPSEPPLVVGEPTQLNDMVPRTEEPPVQTADFTGRQEYLNGAPVGIDAPYGWSFAGGRGAGVKIIDCEWGWRFTHEDLTQNQMGVVVGSSSSSDNHGTAVLGEISGDRNTFGIVGICPDAVVGAASFVASPSAQTIRKAADRLAAGDIILLEIHRPGPNSGGDGQQGFIAIEWWPDDFAAIRYAVSKGIIVVEAAGNGWENLDDPIYDTPGAGFPADWKNPFNPANPSSGAVVVGAGSPPAGTHGRNISPWNLPYVDRARCGFSNWGTRVDCQGWGWEVTSSGYGSLQGGSNRDEWYTDTFSGTSSASPIVVGALGCLQGIRRAQGGPLLTPAAARSSLRATGSPQQAAPGRPTTQRIGNRPDLRQLISIAAKTWHYNKTVSRTYASTHSQNAWALIDTVGWRRIADVSADSKTDMFAAFCEAVANNRRVNVYVDNSAVYGVVLA